MENEEPSQAQPVVGEKRFVPTLADVEAMVNQLAKKDITIAGEKHLAICKRFNLSPDKFVIRLVNNLERGDSMVLPGNPVEILLQWPDCQPILKLKLASAFMLIKRHDVWRTTAIVPFARVQEGKKWKKIVLGEAADLVDDLIPRARLEVVVERKLTLRDRKTGECVSMSHREKPERYDGENVGLWLELSRIVAQKHSQVEETVTVSETPVLDEVVHG